MCIICVLWEQEKMTVDEVVGACFERKIEELPEEEDKHVAEVLAKAYDVIYANRELEKQAEDVEDGGYGSWSYHVGQGDEGNYD